MVPLHPATVHLPLGLALVIPLLALGLAVALWRGWLPTRAWWAVLGLQGLLVLATFGAMRTGEAEEETVEGIVAHAVIEAHEEAAVAFFWATVAALAVSAAVLLVRSERAARGAAVVAVLAALAATLLGVNVGKAGGELVYVHGASNAYAKDGARPAVHVEDDHD